MALFGESFGDIAIRRNGENNENIDWVATQQQLQAKKELEAEFNKRAVSRKSSQKAKAWRKANPMAARTDKFGRYAQGVTTQFGKKVRDPVLENVGEFAGVAQRQVPSFSQEQEMLRQMFGGGEKVWALPDSETGVRINNDLNPSRRGDMETARLFGF